MFIAYASSNLCPSFSHFLRFCLFAYSILHTHTIESMQHTIYKYIPLIQTRARVHIYANFIFILLITFDILRICFFFACAAYFSTKH